MSEFYMQCEMIQADRTLTAWIPLAGAKEGTRLTLENEEGIWTVKKIFLPPQDIKWLKGKQAMDRRSLKSILKSP